MKVIVMEDISRLVSFQKWSTLILSTGNIGYICTPIPMSFIQTKMMCSHGNPVLVRNWHEQLQTLVQKRCETVLGTVSPFFWTCISWMTTTSITSALWASLSSTQACWYISSSKLQWFVAVSGYILSETLWEKLEDVSSYYYFLAGDFRAFWSWSFCIFSLVVISCTGSNFFICWLPPVSP